jgi:hypothetical protein
VHARHWARVAVVSLPLISLAHAQRASLAGVVSDQSGSVVSQVHLTLLNLDQGLKRETVTNQGGYFAIPFLQPGRYLVTAQKDGFEVSEFRDVDLHVGENRGLNIQLRVGAAPVQVHVSANSQQVETVSPALGTVVTADVVRNAPLNGRDIRDLAALQPGVTPTDSDFSHNGVGTFNVAGGRSDSVAYLLDGGFNNDLIDNRAVYVPNPDTVAEFRILTTNYPAEYGRNSGGVISVATQSGTNQWHGTAFDFLRNDALNANSYFNKDNGLPREVLKRNQFGGTLGGPLTIPKVISGKNRFFFFVGYQGQRLTQDLTIHDVSTFTPAELNGDFSQAGVGGAPDPNVIAYLDQNKYFQPDQAKRAQAIIDPTRINSVAKNYIAAGLIPTSPTGVLNPQERLTLNSNELTGKFDFDLDSKNKFAVTIGGDNTHEISPFDYANVPGYPDVSDFHDYLLNFAYTHIFSPNVLNEFRFTPERTNNLASKPDRQLPTPANLGVGVTPDLPDGPSNLFFDTGLSIGFSASGPQRFVDNTFTYSDTFTWIRGAHSWKFGGGFSDYQNNTFFAFYNSGQFAFFGQGGIGSQNSFADFLLGIPLQYFQSSAAASNFRTKFSYGFAQDSWRVKKNLVLDLGLRYEYSTPKRDTEGRTFSIIPGEQSSRFINAPQGMVFPGDSGAPVGVNFPNRNNWAPRVGFAWDPTGKGKTSLRGAGGVFYDILKGEDNLQFNGAPPFYATANLAFSPPGTVTSELNYLSAPFAATGTINPFPSRTPPSNFNFASEGYLPIGGSGGIFVVDPHLRTPYTYQYHLTLQQQLPANTIFQASYAGTSSHGLTAVTDINPFVLGTFDRVLNITPPGSNCGDAQGLPCYGALEEFKNVSNANYNSFLASLQKEFSGGGIFGRSYFTLAYTYSHNVDNASGFENRNNAVPVYDPGLFRASADMDVRHRIVFSGGWDLPFAEAVPKVSKRIAKGWSLFPIISWRTGFPLDVYANLPSAFNFASPGPSGAGDPGLVRANQVSPIQLQAPSTLQTIPLSGGGSETGHFWFNPNSFSNAQCPDGSTNCVPSNAVLPNDAQAVSDPAVRTYGSLPRNYFRGPGRFNVNLAVAKSTPLTEHLRLELRADIFNVQNKAEFNNPDTVITSPTFGRVLDTADPRIIQLSGRLSF